MARNECKSSSKGELRMIRLTEDRSSIGFIRMQKRAGAWDPFLTQFSKSENFRDNSSAIKPRQRSIYSDLSVLLTLRPFVGAAELSVKSFSRLR